MNCFRNPLCAVSLAGVLSLSAFSLGGCKAKSVDDAALAKSIQAQLTSDAVLNGQQVNANVASGVATLSGSVANDAQRSVAARDAAGVTGVKEVVNNLVVPPVAPTPPPRHAPPADPHSSAQL